MKTVKEELIQILKKYTINKDVWNKFTDTSSIVNDLKINSARIVDIVIDIEEKYDVEIPDDDLKKLTCFMDIVELIEEKTKHN